MLKDLITVQNLKVELTQSELESLKSQLEHQQQLIVELSKSQKMLADKINSLVNTQAAISPNLSSSNVDQNKNGVQLSIQSTEGKSRKFSSNRNSELVQFSNLPFYKQFDPSKTGAPTSALSKRESEKLLKRFNSTDKKVISSKPLNKIFEEIAKKNQDFPAVVYGEQFLSFGELNQQANQLAHYLATRGMTEGKTIGIMLPRSLDMIVGILAVLKAGCTYVPLSTSETNRKLQYIVHNANLQAVITLSDISNAYSILDNNLVKVIQLDVEKGGMAEMDTENLNLASPANPVCILYSSSPITPLGTSFTTKSILNELTWFWNEFPYSKTEICCLIARSTRVEFLNEFWGPLLKGIPNVFIPEKTLVDPSLMIDYLNDIRAQRLQIGPSILMLMLQTYPDLGKKLPLVKTWFLRGEQVHSAIL
ncbi:MAG: AMP-binding protein, partial [Chloroflexota bacterium]